MGHLYRGLAGSSIRKKRRSNRALAAATAPRIFTRMSTVAEIEDAVQKLSRSELAVFRDWFWNFDAVAWDRHFEEDVGAGRLDAFAEEALENLREGLQRRAARADRADFERFLQAVPHGEVPETDRLPD